MRMTSGQLKLAARRCLLGKYGTCALLMLVFYLVSFVIQIPYQIINLVSSFLMVADMLVASILCNTLLFVYYILMCLMTYTLSAGMTRYFYRMVVGETCQIGDLFYFVTGRIMKTWGLNALFLLMGFGPLFAAVLLGLGSLALHGVDLISFTAVIIIYSISILIATVITCAAYLNYGLVYYIYNENPEMKVMQIYKESARLMKGNKARSFRLGLSFLGVGLLGIMSAGIGFIWIFPYLCCTSVYFYIDIKNEKASRCESYS